MPVTIIILIVTSVVSFMAFSNAAITDKFIFYPPAISNQKEWYRFFTCGLIHADIPHLAFNMISFYYFGRVMESFYSIYFDKVEGTILYAILYVSALASCMIPTYTKHKNDYYYRSLGASGAVSAVIFASIIVLPKMGLRFFFIPIDIPAYIFGPVYLAISAYLSKNSRDNINHSAHFWGALYGIAYVLVTSYFLSDYHAIDELINQFR